MVEDVRLFLKTNVIFDDQSAMKEKCKDSDIKLKEWSDVAINSLPVRTEIKRKSNEYCAHVI